MKKIIILSVLLLNLLPYMMDGKFEIGSSLLHAQSYGQEEVCTDDLTGYQWASWNGCGDYCGASACAYCYQDLPDCESSCTNPECITNQNCNCPICQMSYNCNNEHTCGTTDEDPDEGGGSSSGGSSGGGSGGGSSGGGSGGGSSGNISYNVTSTINWLNNNSHDLWVTAQGQCAFYVRQALEAGGINTSIHPLAAREYGPYLESWGFRAVNTTIFQAGDIAVIQGYLGGSSDSNGIPYGHIQIYNGNIWISDFKQNGFWPGSGYRKYNPSYVIYRKQ
jgi:hypothetical protein